MIRVRVLAVVQARMSSSRLPGKVLHDLGGDPVLDWVLRAAETATGVDGTVVATSTDPSDDVLVDHARRRGVEVVRGPLRDVLGRFLLAVRVHPCDAVVRLTADCPLLDPALISLVAAVWRADPSWEYVATTLHRSLPRGLDVELVRGDVLEQLDVDADGHHRLHVTSLLYTEPEGRRLLGLSVSPNAADLRVTLDTAEDLDLLTELVRRTGNRVVGWSELVALLRADPALAARNATVRQKPLAAG